MAKTEKIVMLIDECQKLGITVLPPDVNESRVDFTVTGDTIRFGLAAIKNVGVGAVEAIVEARTREGRFNTIYDFCERIESKQVNKKTLESLVLAGAMDTLEGNRAQHFEAIENALSFGQQQQQQRERGQVSLFDVPGRESRAANPPLPSAKDWTIPEKLSKEKSVLGFYISGHPLDEWRTDVEALSTIQLGEFDPDFDGRTVRVCGIVSAIRTKVDKRGRTMAFVTLEDFTGKAECLVFADAYERSNGALKLDAPVVMTGRIESSGDAYRIFPDEVFPIDTAIARFASGILINLSTRTASEELVREGMKALDDLRGSGECPCYISVSDGNGHVWNLYAKQHRVQPSGRTLQRLRTIFGKASVRITIEK